MKVSMVMAVYNGEEYLGEAINSILAQTYQELEIIIVNDCSTDSTAKILEEINDVRVKIIHLAANGGAANALNTAIDRAEGDWIAIHDADDISLPNRIEEQVSYITSNPNVVAVGSLIECIGENEEPDSKTIQMRKLENSKNSIVTWKQIKEMLYLGSPLTHGSMFISKSAFTRIGGYDSQYKIAYDYDLYMRLAHIGHIENVPKVLYKYRILNNSLSNKNLLETSNEFLLALTKYIRSYRFKSIKKKPSIVLYGTKQGCQYFNWLKEIREYFDVATTINDYNEEKVRYAFSEYTKGQIDGFIILSNAPQANTLIDFLVRKGLRLNKHYFTLWSAF